MQFPAFTALELTEGTRQDGRYLIFKGVISIAKTGEGTKTWRIDIATVFLSDDGFIQVVFIFAVSLQGKLLTWVKESGWNQSTSAILDNLATV